MNRTRFIAFFAGLALSLSGGVYADTFNLFQPATGVLKGDSASYITTPAESADIYSLWSGTCDDTTYLRGDGSCQAPPGTGGGTVDSVGLTMPSVFSVANSPVTTTGTLAVTFAGSQTGNQVLATPNGTTGALGLRALVAGDLPAISLTTGVTGTLPVSSGGSGVGTLTGVLKGNGTSAFSAAASSDVIALWSGTCSSGTYLRGDGTCASSGSGTVTSVGLTMPAGFSVANSPVTSAGTLAVTGTLAVSAGGSGVGTLTGVLKGNGTSAFSAAASSDVIALWSGTCSSGTYLRGDGTCQAPSAATGGNPTASIGLTAINGSAGTFLRSDGAPALSQAIAPTWTAQHVFTSTGATRAASAIRVSAAAPYFRVTETDQVADSQDWLFGSGNGVFTFGAVTDAATAPSTTGTALRITRSSNALSDIQLGNTTDNPTYNFVGSGTATFGGPVLAANGSATNPSIAFTNSSGTGFYRQASNVLGLAGAGAHRVLWDATGRQFMSTTTSLIGLGGSNAPQFSIAGNSGNTSAFGSSAWVAGTTGVNLYLGKSRGSTIGTNAIVTDGDTLGTVNFVGDDGTDLVSTGAYIRSQVDGTPGANDMPGRLVLSTTADGSDTPTERLRITSAGAWGLAGTNYGSAGEVLTSNGSSAAPTWQAAGGGSTSGTFTGTLTGMSSGGSCSMKYRLTGSTVTIFIDGGATCTGVSNDTTLTMTGLPSAIQPVQSVQTTQATCSDNSLTVQCAGFITGSTSTLILSRANTTTIAGTVVHSSNTWTSGNNKGLFSGFLVMYDLGN